MIKYIDDLLFPYRVARIKAKYAKAKKKAAFERKSKASKAGWARRKKYDAAF